MQENMPKIQIFIIIIIIQSMHTCSNSLRASTICTKRLKLTYTNLFIKNCVSGRIFVDYYLVKFCLCMSAPTLLFYMFCTRYPGIRKIIFSISCLILNHIEPYMSITFCEVVICNTLTWVNSLSLFFTILHISIKNIFSLVLIHITLRRNNHDIYNIVEDKTVADIKKIRHKHLIPIPFLK